LLHINLLPLPEMCCGNLPQYNRQSLLLQTGNPYSFDRGFITPKRIRQGTDIYTVPTSQSVFTTAALTELERPLDSAPPGDIWQQNVQKCGPLVLPIQSLQSPPSSQRDFTRSTSQRSPTRNSNSATTVIAG
jgi:hypothetical protein